MHEGGPPFLFLCTNKIWKVSYFTERKPKGKTWQNGQSRELAKVELEMPTASSEGIEIVEIESERSWTCEELVPMAKALSSLKGTASLGLRVFGINATIE